MHLKIIVLEIVTNLKSEKIWNLLIFLFPPNKKTKQPPPSEIYGCVGIFNFNKTHIFPRNTVLMKIILQGTIQKSQGVQQGKLSHPSVYSAAQDVKVLINSFWSYSKFSKKKTYFYVKVLYSNFGAHYKPSVRFVVC